MPNAFVDKLRGYAPLDQADVAALEAVTHDFQIYRSGYDLIREGDEPGPIIVVLEGWACRYKYLPDGSRQIIAFMMPGDFCDMHVSVLAEMDHSIGTISEAKIARISRQTLEALLEERPRLTRAFWWTQLVDEGVLRATIVSMGRRNSIERVAHLLCELCIRMRAIGLAADGPCSMPFTQIVLADAVGMTPVHVNRVIGTLRKAGAMKLEGGGITIADLGKLARIAGFDDNYLHRRMRLSA